MITLKTKVIEIYGMGFLRLTEAKTGRTLTVDDLVDFIEYYGYILPLNPKGKRPEFYDRLKKVEKSSET